MSPVPASLHLLTLQLRLILPGLRAAERPLFTPSHKRRESKRYEFDSQRCADYTAILAIFRSVGAQFSAQLWHTDL